MYFPFHHTNKFSIDFEPIIAENELNLIKNEQISENIVAEGYSYYSENDTEGIQFTDTLNNPSSKDQKVYLSSIPT